MAYLGLWIVAASQMIVNYNGLQWITMDYDRLQWITMDSAGLRWITMDYDG